MATFYMMHMKCTPSQYAFKTRIISFFLSTLVALLISLELFSLKSGHVIASIIVAPNPIDGAA